MKALTTSRLIDSCLMESARMNSHVFALNRKPCRENLTLAGYDLTGADCVAICEPMLMVHNAEDKFSNPLTYNPKRFLELNESKDADFGDDLGHR